MTSNPECVWPVRAELGEGVLWSPGEQAVWFVDIVGCRLHRIRPETDERTSWPTPRRPGFVARLADDALLVGLADGLYRFEPGDGHFALLTRAGEEFPENRLNDGAVGPDGHLWFGSKNEPETAATGVWYRWSGAGEPVAFDHGYVVTNGPAFSPDGHTLYHSDSARRRILCRTVSSSGGIGENRRFAGIEPGAGYPDGVAVDTDGCVWVALFAGSGVRRYSPDGALLEEIAVPCRHVTKPAFGGRDGRTLYLTTARTGLSADKHGDQPLAGGLFALRVEAPGLDIPAMPLPPGAGSRPRY